MKSEIITMKKVTDALLDPKNEGKTDKEIGALVGLNQSTVSRVKSRLLERIESEVEANRGILIQREHIRLQNAAEQLSELMEMIHDDLKEVRKDDRKSTKYLRFANALPPLSAQMAKMSDSLRKLHGLDQPQKHELKIKQEAVAEYNNQVEGLVEVLVKYVDSDTLALIIDEFESKGRQLSENIQRIGDSYNEDVVEGEFTKLGEGE